MKNFHFILSAFLLVIFSSCSLNDIKDDSSTALSQDFIPMNTQWYVNYYAEDGNDQTYKFNEYVMLFNTDGTISATLNSNTIKGTWRKVNDSGKQKLEINFPSTSIFEEFNEDWEIIIMNDQAFKLKHISGGNGGTDLLEFGRSKVSVVVPIGGSTGNIVGQWTIIKYQDKDRDRTNYYTSVSFDFKSNNVITATSGSTVTNGTWRKYIDSGVEKIDFVFPAINRLDELNEDWVVVSQSANSLMLKNVSGGNGGISYLDFKK